VDIITLHTFKPTMPDGKDNQLADTKRLCQSATIGIYNQQIPVIAAV
jgi:hypothetical protein